jgi:hypothetical protein
MKQGEESAVALSRKYGTDEAENADAGGGLEAIAGQAGSMLLQLIKFFISIALQTCALNNVTGQ